MESSLLEAAEVCAPEARQNFGVLRAAHPIVYRSSTTSSLKQLKSLQECALEARRDFGVLREAQSAVYRSWTASFLK